MQNALLFKNYVNIFYKGLKKTDNFKNSNYSWHLDKLISSSSQDLELNLNYKSNNQPVCRFLDVAIKNVPAFQSNISSSLENLKNKLNWKVNNNYKNIFSNDFFENESFVEIIGPTGLLICPNIRIGLLLLGKNVFYPSHKHEALELYNILSGTSMWQLFDNDFEKKNPLDNIFHDEWVPHAMKTIGEPVLALFSWSGMINKEAIPI